MKRIFPRACLALGTWLVIMCAAGAHGTSATVTLVKDINAQINPVGSSPTDIVNVNGVAFFTADDGVHGLELWKSDGTEAGTVLVKNIRPYNATPSPDNLVSANGLLFFTADDGTNGVELWKSDGTEAGTLMVKDIWPGSNGSLSGNSRHMAVVNSTLFLSANDGTNGTELWKSDGTAAGTVMVKNLPPGGLQPDHLINVSGTLFFTGYESTNGWELWKSDGTEAGTVMVKDINPGSADSFAAAPFTGMNGTLFFVANDGTNGRELWKSDGTEVGTLMVTNLAPGNASPILANFTVVSGELFFSGNDLAAFPGTTLWKTDGSEAGTLMMTTIDSRSSSFANINGLLYFSVFNGNYLYKSDGTSNGTVLVFDDSFCTQYGIHAYMTPFEFNGMAYFTSRGCVIGGLSMTDGTPAGTVNVKPFIPQGSLPVNVNGTLFFSTDGSGQGINLELWKSDGTSNGTYMVKDIRAATSGSNPIHLTDVNGTLFLSANNGVNGQELWKSDGTTNGTMLVKDVYPGGPGGSPGALANVNGILFFSAYDPTYGRELWKSDGTSNGTVLVKDIYPGIHPTQSYPFGSGPDYLVPLSNIVVFVAANFGASGAPGLELWRSDGTSNGTVIVKDIWPGLGNSDPRELIVVNGKIFFYANDGTNGAELWKTDGTEAGTTMVKDINTGSGSGVPYSSPHPAEMNGLVFFTGYDITNGVELWKSDGTEAGTVLVRSIAAGTADASLDNLLNVNGTLYFSADNGTNGAELWKSDGTSNGTVMVKDINPGSVGSAPDGFAAVNGTLFFRAYDGSSGHELWRSDGTSNGTFRVKDIRPGSSDSTPWNLVEFNGRLFFSAEDGIHGYELWTSDGTEAGTFLLADIIEGPLGSGPEDFKVSGGRLFFTANRLDTDIELFAVSADSDADIDGMPDEWEVTYSLNPTNAADAALDLDADGMSNLGEYRTDTDPTDPGSVLRFTSISLSAGTVSVQFSSRPGLRYRVECRNSTQVPVWTTCLDLIGTGSSIQFADPAFSASRYYRVSGWRSDGDPPTYAVNEVGYVNVTFSAGTNLITRPLLAGIDNYIGTLLPVVPDGTCAYKLNPATQGFDTACYFDGFWEGDNVQILPGKEFFILTPSAFTATFLGEVVPPSAPVITTQPQGQTVMVGSNVTFSVAGMGAEPLAYFWFFNGSGIAGATNAALILSNVQAANAGSYRVVVSNSSGSVTSSAAVLTVNGPVTFADANLEAAVRQALLKPMGPIFISDMLTLITLDLTLHNIVNLSGLESATNLVLLDLDLNSVTNLTPLSGLLKLQILDLWSNPVQDLSPLSNLFNLSSLSLYQTPLTNFAALAGLTNLTTLAAQDCAIDDLAALSGLTRLTDLILGLNHIRDISPLSGLTNLTTLSLSFNPVTNHAVLAGLAQLRELSVSHNVLTDVSFLSGLQRLNVLFLEGNQLQDISPIAPLTNLLVLVMSYSPIADLSPVTNLTALTALWMQGMGLTSLAHLAGLTQLRDLNVVENNLTDIATLASLTNLTGLADIRDNLLDVNDGSPARGVVQALLNRGATVYYLPQRVPTILQQPQSQTAFAGGAATFTVGVTGAAPPTVQWFSDSIPIAGATNDTYSFTATLNDNGRSFYALVSTDHGARTSAVVTLTVSPCLAPQGLVAWWPMDVDVQDIFGTNEPSATNGLSFVPGMVGSGLTLAAGGYVEIPHSASLANQRFTFAAWVRPDGIGPNDDQHGSVIIAKTRDGNFYYALSWNASGQFLFGTGPLAATLFSPTNFHAGSFYFVAGTYDGTAFELYVNGVLQARRIASEAIDYGGFLPWIIGGSRILYPRTWNGVIDEVGIFNRALSSNEVAAIYAAGSAGMCGAAANTPVILVNGRIHSTNVVSATNFAVLEIQSGFPNAGVFFTLDGSDPDQGELYTGPLLLAGDAVVRAVAYAVDFQTSAEADPVSILVAQGPMIHVNPQSQVVAAESPVEFSVAASGAEPLFYQWARNSIDLPFQTNSYLLIANAQPADVGLYSVLVSNVYGAVRSANAALGILQPPMITMHPAAFSVAPGVALTNCVSVTGDGPLRYQWRKNGVNLAGETNECLVISSVQVEHGGSYDVIVANAVSAIVSTQGVLRLVLPVIVPGDDFLQSTLIASGGSLQATNVNAGKEPGEPNHGGKPGGSSVWYRWTAPFAGIATFRTAGSTFDTLLAVYTGPNVSNLVAVASDEDSGGFLTSLVRFSAVAGQQYAIAVDGFGGAEGEFTVSWNIVQNPNPLPVVLQQPQSQTVTLGTNVLFSVIASNAATYLWYHNGAPLHAQTGPQLIIPAAKPEDVGSYRVAITNGAGDGILSDTAALEIALGFRPPGVQSVDKIEDLSAPVAPSGGNLRAARTAGTSSLIIPVRAGLTDSQILSNEGSTTSSGETNRCHAIGGASRWFLIRALTNATMRVDTIGSTIDTILSVYKGTSILDPGFGAVAGGCDDDSGPNGTSIVWFDATNGVDYAVQVDGKNGAGGTVFLNFGLGFAPISTQPAGRQVARQGDSITLTCAATGEPPPAFYWYRSNQAATAAFLAVTPIGVLPLPNLQAKDQGTYMVVISNFIASITNTIAEVVVQTNGLVAGQTGFDSAVEGWSAIGADLRHSSTGGNPGGHLALLSIPGEGYWYWVAPPAYLGNKFYCYGGSLSFELRQVMVAAQLAAEDVILEGAGLRLVIDWPNLITADWTSYRIPLHEAPQIGWRTGGLAGPPATRGEFVAVLTSLTNLMIRGASGPGGVGQIDTVLLLGATTPALSIRADGSDWVVEWPQALGGSSLQAVTALQAVAGPQQAALWLPTPPPTLTNNLNSVRVPGVGAQQFFRLHRPVP